VHEAVKVPVSVIMLVPPANDINAIHCACMSVGNRDKFAVVALIGAMFSGGESSIQSTPVVTVAPASSNLMMSAPTLMGIAFF